MRSLRRQSGMTLVELMIASAVALIMLAGVGQLFLSTRQMNATDEASTDIQDTGRHILHYLTDQIRQAGMLGCAKLGANNYTSSITDYDPVYYHPFNIGIQGFQKGLSTLPPVLDNLSIAAGTDILVIRRAEQLGFRMVQPQDNTALYTEYQSTISKGCADKTFDKINGICPGDILVAVDCQKARSFVVSAISTMDVGGTTEVRVEHNAGNTPSSWGGPTSDNPMDKFDVQDTTLSQAATTAYYISNGNLYQKVNNDTAERMAEGIDYLRVLYGIDSDNDGSVNRYVSASSLSADPTAPDNFNQVVSLQIAILVRSQQAILNANEVGSGTRNYNLLGTTVTLNADAYLHQVFQTTIDLRNRGEG